MAELKARYPATQDFAAELARHEIEYSKNDRAAFVNMGRMRPEALRDALAHCDSHSPRWFWREVESWGDDYYKAGEFVTDEVADTTMSSSPNEPESTTMRDRARETWGAEFGLGSSQTTDSSAASSPNERESTEYAGETRVEREQNRLGVIFASRRHELWRGFHRATASEAATRTEKVRRSEGL